MWGGDLPLLQDCRNLKLDKRLAPSSLSWSKNVSGEDLVCEGFRKKLC